MKMNKENSYIIGCILYWSCERANGYAERLAVRKMACAFANPLFGTSKLDREAFHQFFKIFESGLLPHHATHVKCKKCGR